MKRKLRDRPITHLATRPISQARRASNAVKAIGPILSVGSVVIAYVSDRWLIAPLGVLVVLVVWLVLAGASAERELSDLKAEVAVVPKMDLVVQKAAPAHPGGGMAPDFRTVMFQVFNPGPKVRLRPQLVPHSVRGINTIGVLPSPEYPQDHTPLRWPTPYTTLDRIITQDGSGRVDVAYVHPVSGTIRFLGPDNIEYPTLEIASSDFQVKALVDLEDLDGLGTIRVAVTIHADQANPVDVEVEIVHRSVGQ